jgi:hypothetical protein
MPLSSKLLYLRLFAFFFDDRQDARDLAPRRPQFQRVLELLRGMLDPGR